MGETASCDVMEILRVMDVTARTCNIATMSNSFSYARISWDGDLMGL